MGMLYLDGKGVQRDYVQAYMWFRLAEVEPNLSFAGAHMTPEQILEAEGLAEEWKSRHAGALHPFGSNDNLHSPANCIVPATFKPEQRA